MLYLGIFTLLYPTLTSLRWAPLDGAVYSCSCAALEHVSTCLSASVSSLCATASRSIHPERVRLEHADSPYSAAETLKPLRPQRWGSQKALVRPAAVHGAAHAPIPLKRGLGECA